MQWNLSLQREILPQTAVTATYTGSRGVHLPRGSQVNAPIGEQQSGEGSRAEDLSSTALGKP